jgi:hypothetical protein
MCPLVGHQSLRVVRRPLHAERTRFGLAMLSVPDGAAASQRLAGGSPDRHLPRSSRSHVRVAANRQDCFANRYPLPATRGAQASGKRPFVEQSAGPEFSVYRGSRSC